MVQSLRASVTRASISHQSLFSSTYTCLSCRARAQLHRIPRQSLSTNASSGLTNDASLASAGRAEVNKSPLSGESAERINGILVATFDRIRTPVPTISTKSVDGRFSASTRFNRKTFNSPKCQQEDEAVANVKLALLRHIRRLVRAETSASRVARTGLGTVPNARPFRKLESGNYSSDATAASRVVNRARARVLHGLKQIRRRDRSTPDVHMQRQRKHHASTQPASHVLRLSLPPERGQEDNDVRRSAHHTRVSRTHSRKNHAITQSAPFTRRRPIPTQIDQEDEDRVQQNSRKSKATSKVAFLSTDVEPIRPLKLGQENLKFPTERVPKLQYGLDRVLFNPGVYHLRDPRSRVYNFDPYLEKIIDPVNFDFDSLDEYRTPSADPRLASVATEQDIKYYSSTSAITSVLTAMHQLVSSLRPLNLDGFSRDFFNGDESDNPPKDDFSMFNKAPTSVYLVPSETGYAIDKAEEGSWPGILSLVGMCLEKLFTVPKEVFEWYKVGSKAAKPEVDSSNCYHYTKFGSMLVRSQLDAQDDRLPGSGIFDIKTRAVLPIRMDTQGRKQDMSKNYEIKKLNGRYESYERELYDMARSTMMKYSLQARLGRMDGIFVAYHNVARMFGFQYLSTADMDHILHGQEDPALGDAELKASLNIMTNAFDHATKTFPNEPLRLYFYVRGGSTKTHLQVVVEPVTVAAITSKRLASQEQSKSFLQRLIEAAKNTPDTNNKSIDESDPHKSDDPAQATEDLVSSETAPHSTIASFVASIESSVSNLSQDLQSEDFELLIGDGIGQLVQLVEHLDELYSQEDESQVLDKPANPAQVLQKMLVAQNEFERAFYARFPDLQTVQHATSWSDLSQETTSDQAGSKRLQSRLLRSRVVLESLMHDLMKIKNFSAPDAGMSIDEALSQGTTLNNALKTKQIKKISLKDQMMANHPIPERLAAFTLHTQNIINGIPLAPDEPPIGISTSSDWEISYKLQDVSLAEARELWTSAKRNMLSSHMGSWDDERSAAYYNSEFFRKLMRLSVSGEKWRREQDREDEKSGWRQVVYEQRP